TKTVIESLAPRSEVDLVVLWQEPELIQPIITDQSIPVLTDVENGLEAIGAPEMWTLGYTGVGRLVANLDTGVDGYHPALIWRWRGNNGAPWQECWFDNFHPESNYPQDTYGHGTHTMGTITGLGETTGDTIGVAHGALWIAAARGTNTSAALQWLADPDGDPNTIDDVPDVVSNSWGFSTACLGSFWNEIDNCEAAGIVIVFSAGNRGPGAESVVYPANRNTTPYNTFSVGAVDGHNSNYPIAEWSSRGPSSCDHVSIKPEVVAPGVDIRSSIPGGVYQGGWSGTSMACPHVAGAVALLRQYNPEATPDTIKWALMQSAIDLGNEGEDNTYGHGIINIRAALDFMPPPDAPFIYVSDYNMFNPLDGFPEPGDDVSLVVTLFNTGLGAANVYAILSCDNPFISIVSDSSYWGDIGPNESSNNEIDPYFFSIDENCPAVYDISLNIEIYADGYSRSDDISFRVNGPADSEIAAFDIGNCEFTISNFGRYGLYPSDLNHGWYGQGFITPRFMVNYLYEGALLIGDGPTRVSDAARDENRNVFPDFVPLEIISSGQPGSFADLEYYSAFDDRNADESLGLTVSQTNYGWANPPDDSYIITVYEIANNSEVDLNGIRVAHFEDWDIPLIGSSYDMVNFDRQRNLGYQYSLNSLPFYRGMMILNSEGACSFKALRNDSEVDPPHFTTADKWTYMNSGFSDTAITELVNASMMLTTGPFDIPSGSSVTAAIAILGSYNLDGLQAIADAARAKYSSMTDINNTSEKRLAFDIGENYPNPFNTITVIHYSLPVPAVVKIDIFDILGRKVKTLLNEQKQAGCHQASWNANKVSSGIYFYRIQAGDYLETKKMVLLK
ncbi:MAG: S8 family peptidase, partial [Candidatus Zixiibacteriota bacterium]